MATLNLGKIGIVNKGLWDSDTEYKKLELARKGTTIYICDVISTTNEPPHSDWSKFVEDGTSGFDYSEANNPSVATNPEKIATWINETSGEIFVCTDYTTDDNFWVGQLGTIVRSAGITAPTVELPADTSTDIGKNPTIKGSEYDPIGHSEDLKSVSYQVSDTEDFSNIVTESIDNTTDLTGWTSGDLEVDTTYYVRIEYKSDSYASGWGATASFTTASSFGDYIGEAGSLGFGIGYTTNDISQLGLEELDGTRDKTSAEYGNYKHTDTGSIVVCVLKHYVRIGNSDSPNYDDYGENALDIVGTETFATRSEAEDGGYYLPRVFINGDTEKDEVFIDKYLNSKYNDDKTMSVFGEVPLSLTTNTDYTRTDGMTGCSGILADAVVLGRSRGAGFSNMTTFAWGMLAVLSVAHAQASTSTDNCAWYDSDGNTNYPKGCNSSLADTDDDSVTYDSAGDAGTADKPLCGATANFAKTTHNGQENGIADLNGSLYEVPIGITNYSTGATDTDAISNDDVYVLKESVDVHNITGGYDGANDAWRSDANMSDLYEKVTAPHALGSTTGTVYWGNGNNCVFSEDMRFCGFVPKDNDATNDTGTNQFGTDYLYRYNRMNMVVRCGGRWSGGSSAGLFSRSFGSYRSNGNSYSGFRCLAYLS